MIGGLESHFAVTDGAAALDSALTILCRHWPKAEFEDVESGERHSNRIDLPITELSEVFVYRDCAAAAAWEAKGAVPELSNTMIHLLADPDQLTIVFDKQDGFIDQLVEEVAAAVQPSSRKVPTVS